MLAAAADRERTMDVLKAAFTEGRLTKERVRRADRPGARRADLRRPARPGRRPARRARRAAAPAPYHAGFYPPLTAAEDQRVRGRRRWSAGSRIFPFFAGIPAVILGHAARGQIRQTGERGDGMAVAGLVLGYLGISVWVLIILIVTAHSVTAGPRPARPAKQSAAPVYLGLFSAWPVDRAATNASCGTSTRPIVFIRFLPSFCFSSSLRLRVMSPP